MIESTIEVKEETLEGESMPIETTKQQLNKADGLKTMCGIPATTHHVVSNSSAEQDDDTLFTKIGPKTYTLRWNPQSIESDAGNEDPLGNQDPLEVTNIPTIDVSSCGTVNPQQQQMTSGVKRKLDESGMSRNASILSTTHNSLPDTLDKTKKLRPENNFLLIKNSKNLYWPYSYTPPKSKNVPQTQQFKNTTQIPDQVNLNNEKVKDPVKDSVDLTKLDTNVDLFTDIIEIKDEELTEDLSSETSNPKQNLPVTTSSEIVSSQVTAKPVLILQKKTIDHQPMVQTTSNSSHIITSTWIPPKPVVHTNTPHTGTSISPSLQSSTQKSIPNHNVISPTNVLSKISLPTPVTTPNVSSAIVSNHATHQTSKGEENKSEKCVKFAEKAGTKVIPDFNADIESTLEVTDKTSVEKPKSEERKTMSIADRIDELLKKNDQVLSYRPLRRIPDEELQKNIHILAIKNNAKFINNKQENNCNIYICKRKEPDNILNSNSKTIPKPQPAKKHIACKYCKKEFDTKKEVDDHIKASSQNCMKFPCLICKTYFCNLVKFNDHMINTHKTCKICNEKFKSKYEYTLHEDLHQCGKIIFFTCTHCINDYKSKTALKDHILKAHPGESVNMSQFEYEVKKVPYGCSTVVTNQCVYCDRIYTCSQDLVKHLRSHNIGLGAAKK